MNTTPGAERLHIALFGRRNSGKSSLVNALTGQQAALVSPAPGTTTDPVTKAMEMPGIGPCLFIDTPGFDDFGELGGLRVERTRQVVEQADIALLLFGAECGMTRDLSIELQWLKMLKDKKMPVVLVASQADAQQDARELSALVAAEVGEEPVIVSAERYEGIDELRRAILEKLPEEFGGQSITGGLVAVGDLVLLVMPQDSQAPKGRLILPQVQTIRELLDKRCTVVSCTDSNMEEALAALARAPKLIITDSQVFKTVYAHKPAESMLTSFSILFAGYKGDISYFMESAAAIQSLTASSRVLIAEACTHAPALEDIGRVKIPALLRMRVGQELAIDVVSGRDFPQDLSQYDLVIHCGACMFNRALVLSRVARARAQHVPMTNYGVALAMLNGILDKVVTA